MKNMPPEHSSSDIFFTLNGEPMGSIQTVDIEYEPREIEIKNNENLTLFTREFSCTLEDVKVDEKFRGELFPYDQTFTVIGTGYKLPRGDKLPKKKRIRKKWMKKYAHEFKLDNCLIR
jgi:hypothetical protein